MAVAQLRDMLSAGQSTEVAQEDQQGGATYWKRLLKRETFAGEGRERKLRSALSDF